jgi:hypothetical protein
MPESSLHEGLICEGKTIKQRLGIVRRGFVGKAKGESGAALRMA